METKNHDILIGYMERNHLKNSWLCEKLGRGETWVSLLMNKKITVTKLVDATRISEITNGEVPILGW